MVENKKNIDSYHYHEALDRTYIIMCLLDDILIDHPVFEKNKKLRKKINKVEKLLYEIYQITGNLNFNENEKKQSTEK